MEKRHYRTVVKRVHPNERRIRFFIAAAALVVALCLGFLAGIFVRQDLPALGADTGDLQDQLHQLNINTDADRQTISTLRDHLTKQAAEIADLKEVLAFYKGALTPEDQSAAVVLKRPTVHWDPVAQVWLVQMMLHRGASKESLFEGQASLLIHGTTDGSPAVVTAAPLDKIVETSVFTLSFRYLQQVRGVISFPEAFQPDIIESTVELVAPSTETFRRRDVWSEVIDSV